MSAPKAIFARETVVSVEKSRAEIEATLRRYGATKFASGWEEERAAIGFHIGGRSVRFILPLPPESDFARHSRGVRTPQQRRVAWEQGCRQRWRALTLCIKAKLEAVSAGITTLEEEFLAHTVLPSGRTVWEETRDIVAEHYRLGGAGGPPLLPPPGRA
jgi:hypothetical protein